MFFFFIKVFLKGAAFCIFLQALFIELSFTVSTSQVTTLRGVCFSCHQALTQETGTKGPQGEDGWIATRHQLSNEKIPICLGYMGDCTGIVLPSYVAITI